MRHFVDAALGTSLILIASLVSGCNDTSTTFLASGGVTTNFTVTPSASDGHETIAPSTAQSVTSGSTQTFVVGVSSGYTLNTSVGGSCAAGSWNSNVYTTGAITANCTVIFSASATTYTVTPSSDGNETVSPSTVQTANDNSTESFTVTANAGYTVLSTVGGTCATGSWNGDVYTTGAITSNCTVSFSAALSGTTFTVTPSASDGHETVSPSTAQTVISGSTPSFTLTASSGYTINSSVGGTCAAGSWSGLVYTTGAVTANCTVTFSAVVTTYTVTPSSSDGHETIAPAAAQVVNTGGTQAFTVTAAAGYTTNTTVGGTCATGSWSGAIYTTGAITSNCSVIFSAAARAEVERAAASRFSTPSHSTSYSSSSNPCQAERERLGLTGNWLSFSCQVTLGLVTEDDVTYVSLTNDSGETLNVPISPQPATEEDQTTSISSNSRSPVVSGHPVGQVGHWGITLNGDFLSFDTGLETASETGPQEGRLVGVMRDGSWIYSP